MLKQIRIQNLALISKTEISFGPGFCAVTGETGAGKSVFLTSLKLCAGERATAQMIRNGEEKAIVEAVFQVEHLPDVLAKLESMGVDPDDGEITIQREILANGKSRARINGSQVNLADLSELGDSLVQLHGQSEQIMLRDIRTHIQMLDAFGNLLGQRESYHAAWLEWQKCLREEAELRQKAADLAQQKEFLGFQAEELSKAHIQPGEDTLLEERLAEANGVQNRRKHLDESLEILQGEHGVIGQLSQLERSLANLSAQNKGLAGFASQVGEAQILFREMSREILALGKGAPMSPAEIERDNARLALLQRLQRKYRTDLNGLIELRDRRKQELSTLDNLDASLAQLEKRSKTWRVKVDELGKQLHESRVECAKRMDQEVQSQVQSLGMSSARFHTLVESADPSPLGIDRVEFLMAPNSGEGEKPLRQAVSGGELSRVLLAFKSVMAARDLVPVLVFDEVDSGISGEIAHRIGACLQKLGESHQVLTITHLHQVASRAKAHLQVSKSETDGRTLTQISTLSDEARIREIARMLGDPNSSAVIQHARQLIEDNHA